MYWTFFRRYQKRLPLKIDLECSQEVLLKQHLIESQALIRVEGISSDDCESALSKRKIQKETKSMTIKCRWQKYSKLHNAVSPYEIQSNISLQLHETTNEPAQGSGYHLKTVDVVHRVCHTWSEQALLLQQPVTEDPNRVSRSSDPVSQWLSSTWKLWSCVLNHCHECLFSPLGIMHVCGLWALSNI